VRRTSHEPIEIIQLLRGIAALLVVLFHVRWAINGPAYLDLGDRLFSAGFCGVDLFFLISGFIMVHVTADSTCRPRDVAGFVIKRWSRVWPPYVVATLVFIAVDPETRIDHQLVIDVGKAFVFYPRNVSALPFFGWAPLVVGWTLCYEVWFYVGFAVSMLARRWRWVALGAFFATFLVALPMLFAWPRLNAYAAPIFGNHLLALLSNAMMWEFAAGAVIAALYRSRLALPPFWAKVLAAFAATVFAWAVVLGWGRHGPLSWGIPSALVLVGALVLHKSCALRVPRVLVWLGDISFSLYLWHRVVQIGLLVLMPRLGMARWIAAGGAYAFASTMLSLLVAAISHRYLERGLCEWLKRRLIAMVPGR
jgi:peptidoglycan/LPS O-acetylase OafA/YrhL